MTKREKVLTKSVFEFEGEMRPPEGALFLTDERISDTVGVFLKTQGYKVVSSSVVTKGDEVVLTGEIESPGFVTYYSMKMEHFKENPEASLQKLLTRVNHYFISQCYERFENA